MRCPYCKNENTEVIDSREVLEGSSIRRRRECAACKKRFTTYEKVDHADVTVVKRNGTREPFDRGKVLGGMAKACEKRNIGMKEIDDIADRIEMRIRSRGVKEIGSSEIGDMVIKELFRLDPVAYIRFASVYENFESPEEFRKAVSIFKSGAGRKNERRRED